MSLGRGGGGGGGSQGNYPGSHPGRRSREERRSLSESLADGTSKFFSSMVAKKNGLFSDISSKLENTFAPKTDTISNSTTGSERSSPTTPPPPNTPPPRPPPPKRLPSLGNAREKEKENVIRRMASVPTYTRSDQWSDAGQDVTQPRGHLVNHKGANSEDRISVNGMNISFDEPILYNTRDATTVHTSSDLDNQGNRKNVAIIERDTIVPSSTPPQPRPAPRSQKASSNDAQQRYSLPSNYGQSARHYEEDTRQSKMTYEQRLLDEVKQMSNEVIKLTESVQRSDESLESCPRSGDKKPDSDSGASDSADDSHARKKAPMFTNTKRRSSTVDEMLFDDYVEPVVDPVVILPDEPPENLICFETEPDPSLLIKSPDSSLDDDQCKVTAGTSIDSSDVEYGGSTVHRSGSVGSDKSCSSNYSIDSQPDDVTLTCVEFMKLFVDKVFREREEISQTEKAKFGELCQYSPGRLWFSRYVNSQRVHNKRVTEPVFFRLMQYFAVCLFECKEAEDFSPAKTLMTMCFTFYYEGTRNNCAKFQLDPRVGVGEITCTNFLPDRQTPSSHGETEKVFLYTYMRDQPIWQSLRFWNAAFFDAVQCERSRRPMPTNTDGNETVTDDKQFQENITFGQLGTFACNMRSFGLSKELCLEFLRKQSTIANLRKDQVKLLRDNIERFKEN